jgi:hypothetical protein
MQSLFCTTTVKEKKFDCCFYGNVRDEALVFKTEAMMETGPSLSERTDFV